MPLLPPQLDEYKEKLIPNYRIMQFSGDADPCVPYVGTQRWIDSLGLQVDSAWHPWTAAGPHDSGMVAGYVQDLRVHSGRGEGCAKERICSW